MACVQDGIREREAEEFGKDLESMGAVISGDGLTDGWVTTAR